MQASRATILGSTLSNATLLFHAASPGASGARRRPAASPGVRRVLPAAALLILSLGLGSLAVAGVAPNGREFHVNTYTSSYQSRQAVGMDGDGDFVVAWMSDGQDGDSGGIFAQRFDSSGSAVGAEFQVNALTTKGQSWPVVGMDGDGDFVVVWESYGQDGDSWGIFAQRYDSSGSAVGAEFLVNTDTTSSQASAAVGMDGDGDFVVVWRSWRQGGPQYGILAQRYDSSGSAVGAEFLVNTYTTSSQIRPDVGMDGDGDFVVAWESYGQDGDGWGIFAQRYDSSGAALGAEFQVNTYETDMQSQPAVGMDGDGDFVVVWESYGQDGSDWGIFAQRYDSSGSAVGAEFQVSTYTTSWQTWPAVGMDGDGDFVVVWSSDGQDGSDYGIFAQSFDSSGSAVSSEFQVNTYTTHWQGTPAVGMDGDGEFVVVWTSSGQDGSSYGIFGQRVLTNGPVLTSPLSGDTLDCSSPALSRPTFTWHVGDYDRFKVFMGSSAGFEKGTRVTSGDRKIRTDSWTPGKKKWKRACNKAINQAADPNHPVMYVKVKGIDRDVRKKDPLRKLFSFPVCAEVQP
jgi:hypothetical protein